MELIHDIDDRDDTLVVAEGESTQTGQEGNPEDIVGTDKSSKTIRTVGDVLG